MAGPPRFLAIPAHDSSISPQQGRMGSLCDSQLPHEPQTRRIPREAESAATLALQVVDQSTQRNVLPLASRAVIDPSLVRGAGEMLVQAR